MKIAETLRLSLMNNTSNIILLLLTIVMLLSLMMIARKLISANGLLLLLLLQYVKQKLLQLISAQPSKIRLLVQLIKHADMMLAFAPDL
jgi:hypothetical protein